MTMLAEPRPDRRTETVRPPALELREVTKTYDGSHTVLDRVSLDVRRGTFLTVVGPAGSGKSTLLHCAAGLDDPTSGEARIGGRRISGLSEAKRTLLRCGRIGFVFESYNLLPSLTVEENLQLPLRLAGAKTNQDWIGHLAARTGIAGLLHRRPAELSPGQQQRAAIARALAARPEIVFADEPTGALDPEAAAEILDLMRDLVDDWGLALVMVSRDAAAASRAHATWELEGGRARHVLTTVE